MDVIEPELAERAFQLAVGAPPEEPRIVIFAFAPAPDRLILGPRRGVTHGDLVSKLREKGPIDVEQVLTGFIYWMLDEEPGIQESSRQELPAEVLDELRRQVQQRIG